MNSSAYRSSDTYKKGFTLIELMIVVGIIAVLSALVIAVINPNVIRKNARDVNRKKDLAIISAALEQYYADYNEYPGDNSGATPSNDIDQIKCILQGLFYIDSSGGSCGSGGPPLYLKNVPTREGNQSLIEYFYYTDDSSTQNAQNYVICSYVELEKNANVKATYGNDYDNVFDLNDGANYIYGLSYDYGDTNTLYINSTDGDYEGVYCLQNPF